MLCKRPFVKSASGVRRLDTILSQEARLAATESGCGQCLHCRINKSRVWVHRILLEQACHSDSCFLTLTYNEDHYPATGSLKPDDLQLFLKRLRRRFEPIQIRFFAVGEYGAQTLRAHYHLCLFGLGYNDADGIEKAWGMGFVHLGDLTPASAAYIAGYIIKGMTSSPIGVDGIHPEFMRCSRNPGIGYPAIPIISKTLRANSRDPPLVSTLRHGRKIMSLGRYLKEKLAIELGKQDSLQVESYDSQQEVFDKYFDDTKTPSWYDRLLLDSLGKRQSQEAKHKLFTAKRSL